MVVQGRKTKQDTSRPTAETDAPDVWQTGCNSIPLTLRAEQQEHKVIGITVSAEMLSITMFISHWLNY